MRSRHALTAASCTLILLLAAQLLAPAPAVASVLPNPLDLVPDALDPAHYIVEGFKALISWIFGDTIDELGHNLVGLLLAVPILTDKGAFPRLNEYRGYVTGGAWGVLGLSFVIASMRYWLAGFTGGGSYEALNGFARATSAVCMLLVFAPAFDQVARAVNAMTAALVTTPIVAHGLQHGIAGTLVNANLIGGGVAMLITIAALIAALILLVVKVIVTALLAVLFVASPLAIALWPVEEAAWALRSLLSAIGALLAFPILWALCFGTFAVLSPDALFPGRHGDLINSVLAPLITLASLIIAFRLPFAVLQQAMNAGIAPGVNRAVHVVHNVRAVMPSRTKGAA